MFNKKGFTLVELLMVVIIIGVLVTIAIPNYTKAVERSKGGKAKATLDAVRKAQLQFRALNDSYTQSIIDLTHVDFPYDAVSGDGDWSYTVTSSNWTNSLVITAHRMAGPYQASLITIDEDGTVDINSSLPW